MAQATASYPQEGRKAPEFSLPGSDGNTVSLEDFAGRKNVVLYFYPKDDTPGCTTEACGFRDLSADYEKADTVILGVSPDGVASHRRFIGKFNLPFTLLADEDHAVCEKYGVWQEKSRCGKTYMGVARTTFVIDKDGKVAKVFAGVKPEGHNSAVLEFIRSDLM